MKLGDELDDLPRVTLRNMRKAVGLPASYDVGILATQIQNLLKAIGSGPDGDLGFKIIEVVISIPHLAALYKDDLEDAAEYAGVKYRGSWTVDTLLREVSVIKSGYGLNPENGEPWPEGEIVWILQYSLGAFGTMAGELRRDDYDDKLNFTLGLDAVGKGGYGDEDGYWNAMREEIDGNGSRFFWMPELSDPDIVLIAGDAANDARFRAVVGDYFKGRKGKVVSHDPILAAAKGTAEFYWRYVASDRYNRQHLDL
jgi:hypothetical protein